MCSSSCFFLSLLENSPAVFPDRTRPRTRVRVQTQRITADRRHTHDIRVRHPVARDRKRNEPSPEVSIPVRMMLGWLVGLVKDRMASLQPLVWWRSGWLDDLKKKKKKTLSVLICFLILSRNIYIERRNVWYLATKNRVTIKYISFWDLRVCVLQAGSRPMYEETCFRIFWRGWSWLLWIWR